jgi:hypothetical protein
VTYQVRRYDFNSVTLDFHVQGFDLSKLASHQAGGGIPVTDAAAQVMSLTGTSGTGSSGTETGVCEGTLSTTFLDLE